MQISHFDLKKIYNLLYIIFIVALFVYFGAIGSKHGFTSLTSNFPFRKQMISFVTEIRLKIGDRVFQQTLVSDSGWLEFLQPVYMNDYQNIDTFKPANLQRIDELLEDFNTELSKRQITLLIVIAPNKATIYPENMPVQIQKAQAVSRLDTFLEYMDKHAPPIFVDLRPSLLEAKQYDQIYYATDTHWNPIGAYYGYTAIMEALSVTHPQLHQLELNKFTKTLSDRRSDLVNLMQSTSLTETSPELRSNFEREEQWIVLNNENPPVKISLQPNSKQPRILIYHDSFGLALMQFLPNHFSEAAFVNINVQEKDLFSYGFIDQVAPDIIIIEIVERALPRIEEVLTKFDRSITKK